MLKLITSKFSPYGHRIEMALLEKNLPYEKVIVDLANRPDWFVKESPFGKVPLLYVDDKILFESIAICEYLDDAYPQIPLHSQDLAIRAQHRAWMEVSNAIIAGTLGMVFAQNQEQLDIKKVEVISKLAVLEKNLRFGPYFDGNKFSLVDICLASALKPLSFIDNKFSLEIFERFTNISDYSESLITRGSLHKALPQDYEEIFKNFLIKRNSHLLTLTFTL
jgi:glutathione S-transferase